MKGFLLKELKTSLIISAKDSNEIFLAASLIKPLYALCALDNLKLDDNIEVSYEDVQDFGTNVLKYIVPKDSKLQISILSLIHLMLAFSCNSSAKIIKKKLGIKSIQNLIKSLGLTKTKVYSTKTATTCLEDIYKIYEKIFKTEKYLEVFKFATATNKYYLFDQLKLQVLTSKTGTIKEKDLYTLNNAGIVKIEDDMYFMGGFTEDKDISAAVYSLRKLGNQMYDKLVSN